MSSAYGTIPKPQGAVEGNVLDGLPATFVLRDGTEVVVQRADGTNAAQLTQLWKLLNRIIEDGDTYPQEHTLSEEGFRAYFLSHDAFVLVDRLHPSTVYGAFYVKPNFPGRCSHICNGGFIVEHEHRGKGVGKAMATAFIHIAPRLGYKASMFNLVFASNAASVNLWRSTGFREIGRLPAAGRLKGSDELVDAIMFHYDFSRRSNE
eukprot:jgi/Hompol1/2920/HPOL_006230-RA